MSLKPLKSDSLRRDVCLCVFSAVLLILANPKTDVWLFAWIGLVPFLLAIEGKGKIKAFLLGYITGFLYFSGTLYWFVHVTWPGASIIILIYSLYFAIFALGCSFIHKKNPVLQLFFLPSLWVSCEYVRAHFPTPFDWASLGHSQYSNIFMIQISDITGVFGVSFVLVMINLTFKNWIYSKVISFEFIEERTLEVTTLITIFFTFFVYYYGIINSVRYENDRTMPGMNVAVIQGNIKQEEKWEEKLWPVIKKKYIALTEIAVRKKPDLIIWPETSFPGFLWEDYEHLWAIEDLIKRIRTPLIFGTIYQNQDIYHNSAMYMSSDGRITRQYDKLHLVPFGEYIPFRNVFPFLEDIVPIADFTKGDRFTLFYLSEKGFSNPVSVLICFEDTMAELSREFVRKGARLLINITNDAWFKDTKAPYLHLQSAVFRAVENRRSLIRATNTGVSAFIDRRGMITNYVQNKRQKKTFIPGFAVERVYFSHDITIYTRFGDIFSLLCFVCVFGGIIGKERK